MFFRFCTGRMNQNGGTRSVSQQDAGPRGRLETDKDFVATAWKDGKVTLPSNCEDCQVKCKTMLGKTLSELWCPLIRTSMKDASWCPQFEISTGIELFQNLWHAYRHSCAVVKTHLLAVGPERVTLNAVSSCCFILLAKDKNKCSTSVINVSSCQSLKWMLLLGVKNNAGLQSFAWTHV